LKKINLRAGLLENLSILPLVLYPKAVEVEDEKRSRSFLQGRALFAANFI
jgi:hypothetical protein